MVYEQSIETLMGSAETLDRLASNKKSPQEYKLTASYCRMCAIAKKYGVPEENQLVKGAEYFYARAQEKKNPDLAASIMIEAIAHLEQALLNK